MRQYFTMSIEGENSDDVIGQVENALTELKNEVVKSQDAFGEIDGNLTGTGWDLEVLED